MDLPEPGCVLYSTDSGHGPMSGFYQDNIEPSGLIKGEEFPHQLYEKGSSLFSYMNLPNL
jgi:hypothetical protein